jgi:hypothetical protein
LGGDGKQRSVMNRKIALAMYVTGVNPNQVLEICAQAGIVSPTENNLYKIYNEIKANTMIESKEQLTINRKKHVAACRALPGYKGEIVFSKNGVNHSIARGPICGDGAGEKRAYGHRITGDQHVTILFSLVTGDPLIICHDQISCINCRCKLTKLMYENDERLFGYDNVDLSHDGRCFRNFDLAPSYGETWAFPSLGKDLLIDPATGVGQTSSLHYYYLAFVVLTHY